MHRLLDTHTFYLSSHLSCFFFFSRAVFFIHTFVFRRFVDSSGFLVLQKWMKLARKDPTNPPCLQVLEKAILVLHELPLTLKHLQGSSVGVTVSKLAADTNATLSKDHLSI